MLALKILERGEKRFGRFDRKAACSQPGHARTLPGDVTRTLKNMAPNHLQLGFGHARRVHRGALAIPGEP